VSDIRHRQRQKLLDSEELDVTCPAYMSSRSSKLAKPVVDVRAGRTFTR